jgi:hypothetical protein
LIIQVSNLFENETPHGNTKYIYILENASRHKKQKPDSTPLHHLL